jgi:hypothetical protein
LGEYVESNVAVSTVGSWVSNTAQTITSISLTAGDWDVEGGVLWSNAAVAGSATVAGISTTAATLPADGPARSDGTSLPSGIAVMTHNCGKTRISLSSTTTVYLIGRMAFTSAPGLTAGGWINARRVR